MLRAVRQAARQKPKVAKRRAAQGDKAEHEMSESTTVKLLIILYEHLILITHEAVIGGYYMLSVFIKHGGFQVPNSGIFGGVFSP